MDRRVRLLAGVGLVVLVALLGVLVSPGAVLDRLAWVAADPLRLTAALVVVAVVRPLFAWPTTPLAVVAGYGLGLRGFPLALVLVVVTSLPPYWVAGLGAGDGSVAAAGERLVAETGDLRSVVGSRLLPLPSDVVSAGAGVAGVPVRAFALGTAIGEVPWVAAGVVAGASFGAIGEVSLSAAMDPRIVVGAAALAVLVFAEPTYRLLQQ
ncbi:VTT domain-containing protein [Haloplanus aerogenes]|uniref:Putative membrane protein YdjX (TVP38/TMEM64 family) n=1 Tax=Haloplanus aerogenes TaxID=660522 RepID=A0A3M0CT45_9EURY|nr:VTT domain-containing protein [Haloplanus aerogenes]AZH26503.1 TVP38/TMEM64 family protein [Haloplanus aerogenes]RMB12731.1 putative membrane protein YdjX (TVP38/TMEM64 family) [Haloplanus aerogenes]